MEDSFQQAIDRHVNAKRTEAIVKTPAVIEAMRQGIRDKATEKNRMYIDCEGNRRVHLVDVLEAAVNNEITRAVYSHIDNDEVVKYINEDGPRMLCDSIVNEILDSVRPN